MSAKQCDVAYQLEYVGLNWSVSQSCRCVFFFSSRRRHTRLVSDWSSDVCSSDLLDGRSGAPAVAEDAPLRPSSPYSASKAGGDMQVLAYVRTYGIDACITRGANKIGRASCRERV